jgi:hypothetical protein
MHPAEFGQPARDDADMAALKLPLVDAISVHR